MELGWVLSSDLEGPRTNNLGNVDAHLLDRKTNFMSAPMKYLT